MIPMFSVALPIRHRWIAMPWKERRPRDDRDGRYRDDRDGAGGHGLEVDYVHVYHMCILPKHVNICCSICITYIDNTYRYFCVYI